MDKLELFNQIVERLWNDEIVDINNYNNDFESFKKDVLNIFQATFDGIIL